MNDKKILEMINAYFDGELGKGDETFLFTQLSSSEEGREYFKRLSRIKTAVDESLEEFPEELDERILRSVSQQSNNKTGFFTTHKIFTSVSYTFALILLIVSAYLLVEVNDYKDKMDILSYRMLIQSQTIEMLYNSLPGIEIRATYDNEIIVKSNL